MCALRTQLWTIPRINPYIHLPHNLTSLVDHAGSPTDGMHVVASVMSHLHTLRWLSINCSFDTFDV